MLVDRFSILCIPGCRIVKLASKKAGKDGGHERAQPPLGAWCAAMPYRGRRGKSRGCFALDKEGITLCNRKKK